mmetsp:Transcript_40568/g.53215  ORF Transcript_40568/g.53215 Transcript_40568/m.53215 type:complete len:85 (+) Transcript_40568:2024-2278(+)
MAKLNFREEVTMHDVDESLKLMDFSFRSLRRLTGDNSSKRNAKNADARNDRMGEIMRVVKDVCTANSHEPIALNDLLKRLQKKQ